MAGQGNPSTQLDVKKRSQRVQCRAPQECYDVWLTDELWFPANRSEAAGSGAVWVTLVSPFDKTPRISIQDIDGVFASRPSSQRASCLDSCCYL